MPMMNSVSPIIAAYLAKKKQEEDAAVNGAPPAIAPPTPTTPPPAQNPFGAGEAVAVGLSGLGDAFNGAAGKPTNHSKETLDFIQKAPEVQFADQERQRTMATQKDEDDPLSGTSQQYQALAAKFTGKKPEDFSSMSATKIKNVLPATEKLYQVSEETAARKEIAANNLRSHEDLMKIAQQNKDREFGLQNEKHNETQWTNFQKENDPTTGSSRTVIGMLGQGNMKIDRAANLIKNNKMLTNADLGAITADVASVFQNGAPTDIGMKHQNYDSLQGKIAGLAQYVTGSPKDAVPPAIRQRLLSTLADLKNTNRQILKEHNDALEKSNKWLLEKHPDEWQEFRAGVEGADSSQNNSNSDASAKPDKSGYVVGKQYKMKDGNMATYQGNGSFQ